MKHRYLRFSKVISDIACRRPAVVCHNYKHFSCIELHIMCDPFINDVTPILWSPNSKHRNDCATLFNNCYVYWCLRDKGFIVRESVSDRILGINFNNNNNKTKTQNKTEASDHISLQNTHTHTTNTNQSTKTKQKEASDHICKTHTHNRHEPIQRQKHKTK